MESSPRLPNSRREFLRKTAILAGAVLVPACAGDSTGKKEIPKKEEKEEVEIKIEEKRTQEKKEYKYMLGETEISFSKESFGEGPIFLNLHSNENSALESVSKIVEKNGGSLIKLENKNRRNVSFVLDGKSFTFDPNRIFSYGGVVATLEKNSKNFQKINKEEKIKVIDAVLSLRFDIINDFDLMNIKNTIISLHNNKDSSLGGGLSIKSYLEEEDEENEKEESSKTYLNPEKDIDDFVYVTREEDFNALKQKGYNTVFYNFESKKDFGSLGVFLGKSNVRYFNPEAQFSHKKIQEQMIVDILEIVKNK